MRNLKYFFFKIIINLYLKNSYRKILKLPIDCFNEINFYIYTEIFTDYLKS